MKNKAIIGLMLWIGFVIIAAGSAIFLMKTFEYDYEKHSFCLDVIYNQVTNDPETISECQEILEEFRVKIEKRDEERNQKFLDKIERNTLTTPGE